MKSKLRRSNNINSFRKNQLVLHRKTKRVYVIVADPRRDHLLEEHNEMFYSYRDANYRLKGYKNPHKTTVWHRRKSEMEDGRFVPYITKRPETNQYNQYERIPDTRNRGRQCFDFC